MFHHFEGRVETGYCKDLYQLLAAICFWLHSNSDCVVDTEEDKKQPYSLIGFGGGVHSCIGVELAQMEMKIILSTLLQKYDWTVTPTTTEIAPVRRPTMTEKKLKATFVAI